VEAPATSRHTRHSLWLLPSGPDQVYELVLREDQGPHRASLVRAKEWKGLSSIDFIIASLNPSNVFDCEPIGHQLNKSSALDSFIDVSFESVLLHFFDVLSHTSLDRFGATLLAETYSYLDLLKRP